MGEGVGSCEDAGQCSAGSCQNTNVCRWGFAPDCSAACCGYDFATFHAHCP